VIVVVDSLEGVVVVVDSLVNMFVVVVCIEQEVR